MPTVSDRIKTAVDAIDESSDVAQQFIDPSNTSEIVREQGNLKPLGLIQQEADAAIQSMAAFREEAFVVSTVYYGTEKVYFVDDGVAYTPVSYPYTTGLDVATDVASDKLMVLQGLTNASLKQLLSYFEVTAAGTTTPRPLMDWFSDVVSSKAYGVGVGGDDTIKVQKLVNENKNVLIQGDVVLDGSVSIPSGTRIFLDCSIAHNGSYYPLHCSGAATAITITTSSHTDVFSSFNVDSTEGINVGDYLRLVSTQSSVDSSAGDWQLDDASDPAYFSEFVQVKDVSGSTISIAGKTNFPLYPSGSSVELIDFAEVKIEGKAKSVKEGDSFELVRLDFCKDSIISGIEEDSKTYTGPTVTIRDSLNCEGVGVITKLDPSTQIDYLGNRPAYPDYFQYNSLKIISSQSCGFVDCKMFNGTQNIDITYSGKPSINCYAKGNRIYYARHNMMTSHAGSFNNIFESNIGIMCERGISSRSRADQIRFNIISGVSKVGDNIEANTYGIAVSDGFNKGALIHNNDVSGFYRNYLLNTGNKNGFVKNSMKLLGGTSSDAIEAVTIDRATSNPNNSVIEDQGIEIHNLVMFDINPLNGVIELNSPYLTGVVINNCTFPEDIGVDNYCIVTEDNCTGLTVSNNIFSKVGRVISIGGITDPGVGENTVRGLNATWLNNSRRGYDQDDSFVFDGSFVGGLTPIQSELDIRNVSSTDVDLQVGGQELLELNNTSGTTLIIENLIGGVKGQQLFVYASSGSGAIEIDDLAGNISLKNSSVFTLSRFASGAIKLICISDSTTGGSSWMEM